MSIMNRLSGAMMRQVVSRHQQIVKLNNSHLRSTTSNNYNNTLRLLSTTTIKSSLSSSSPTSSPSASPSTTTIQTKSNSTITATSQGAVDSEVVNATSPTALPTGYIDEYHNHGHRFMPGDPTKRAFTYLILGSTQFIAASAARVAILKLIYTMSASADVLALGSVEVDLNAIPLGESATIKWRGKPVFIRHRTQEEVDLAAEDDEADLRHPESDISRVVKPQWLVVLGVCTHLGCVPIANAGDYQGWFCPCHGSHYDVSGRIRKGPAPLNLEVPPYQFIEEDTKMILG